MDCGQVACVEEHRIHNGHCMECGYGEGSASSGMKTPSVAKKPTVAPTLAPTATPTPKPTATPTPKPTAAPIPTPTPTPEPTATPTPEPTATPTPTAEPTQEPTATPEPGDENVVVTPTAEPNQEVEEPKPKENGKVWVYVVGGAILAGAAITVPIVLKKK